ncbi:hypothetical protein IV203_012493 [Nitzschia inconspicua]|uniref:Uncharacterized protein n=1 Tax=Nitzschia inconspicua TaxID=303405 RepID=A0A9K3KUW1_9STRA|nr:hypothetical protein IV203_012493 [Nitzschia inconspicua]
MPSLVNEIIVQLPSTMTTGPCATPEVKYLFEVNNKAEKLSQDYSALLQRMTTQWRKQARPNLQTAVAFLTTSVVALDSDNTGMLFALPMPTAHPPSVLVLEANCMVDASMQYIQTCAVILGATIPLNKGSVYWMST